jgi:hypothetical protein
MPFSEYHSKSDGESSDPTNRTEGLKSISNLKKSSISSEIIGVFSNDIIYPLPIPFDMP